MKITKRQLRKLIEESFVVDPEGTVYTPQTVKAYSEYGEVMGDGSTDEMDVPAVYGVDKIRETTPKLAEFLGKKWQSIFNMHEKGSKIYMILADRETDSETKIQFLHLINMDSDKILPDRQLEELILEIDLLTSPDFQVFRDQAAERLKKKHYAEIFDDIMKEKGLANNPQYIRYAKKQIDKAIAAGYAYYKDAVQLQFFYDMYDLKEKNFKPSYIGYNPDGGVEPEIFAANNGGRIQDRVENHYSITDKVHDATMYNDDLWEYSVEKSTELVEVIINDLVDAGILEKNKDGRVKMSERTYQITLNNTRGRNAEFYKERGLVDVSLDNVYVPNPNLPTTIRERKMKITRRQLRRLIAEAMKQKVPLFGPDMFDALRQKGRKDADISGLSDKQKANLDNLGKSDPNMQRSLYQTLGSTEPDISAEQEKDYLAQLDPMFRDAADYNLNQAFEAVFVSGQKNASLLEQLGFMKASNYLNDFRPVKQEDYNLLLARFDQLSEILEKPVENIYVKTPNTPNQAAIPYYDMLKKLGRDKPASLSTATENVAPFGKYNGYPQLIIYSSNNTNVAVVNLNYEMEVIAV